MSMLGEVYSKHHWMIEVINDLRNYAREHGLLVSEDFLDGAMTAVTFEVNRIEQDDIVVEKLKSGVICPPQKNFSRSDVEFAQPFEGANEWEKAVSRKPRSLG